MKTIDRDDHPYIFARIRPACCLRASWKALTSAPGQAVTAWPCPSRPVFGNFRRIEAPRRLAQFVLARVVALPALTTAEAGHGNPS